MADYLCTPTNNAVINCDCSRLQDFHHSSVNQSLSITIALLIFSRCGLFPMPLPPCIDATFPFGLQSMLASALVGVNPSEACGLLITALFRLTETYSHTLHIVCASFGIICIQALPSACSPVFTLPLRAYAVVLGICR